MTLPPTDNSDYAPSFLNKIDLLKDKLESGVRFDKYIVSYGKHPNDVPSVTSCEVSREFTSVFYQLGTHYRPKTAVRGESPESSK